jgi:hypothetical protein
MTRSTSSRSVHALRRLVPLVAEVNILKKEIGTARADQRRAVRISVLEQGDVSPTCSPRARRWHQVAERTRQ